MNYVVAISGEQLEVTVEGSTVRLADYEGAARLTDVDGTPIRIIAIGTRVYRVLVRRGTGPGQFTLDVDGFRFEVEALDERTRAIRQLTGGASKPIGPSSLSAPMPGLVVRVLVGPGDRVQPGQALVVIEAMKMENELRASSVAVVRAVPVAPGNAVEKGALLIEFDPLP